MALKSINPATGETLATFDTLSPAAVEDKLQVSMDGTAWSDVAEGQGQSPTTTVAVKPVQAKFVRVTVATAPPTPLGWAIQRLRIFTVGSVTP